MILIASDYRAAGTTTALTVGRERLKQISLSITSYIINRSPGCAACQQFPLIALSREMKLRTPPPAGYLILQARNPRSRVRSALISSLVSRIIIDFASNDFVCGAIARTCVSSNRILRSRLKCIPTYPLVTVTRVCDWSRSRNKDFLPSRLIT